jgi:hypothetical protein
MKKSEAIAAIQQEISWHRQHLRSDKELTWEGRLRGEFFINGLRRSLDLIKKIPLTRKK